MIGKFLKYMFNWQGLLLIGIFVLFIAGGLYAKISDNDSETMRYAIWIVAIVGLVFFFGSFFSFRKKERIRKEQEAKYGKPKSMD